jgi:hypothetical protein
MAKDEYNALRAAYAAYEKATGGDPKYRRNLVAFEDAFKSGDGIFTDDQAAEESPGKAAAREAADG